MANTLLSNLSVSGNVGVGVGVSVLMHWSVVSSVDDMVSASPGMARMANINPFGVFVRVGVNVRLPVGVLVGVRVGVLVLLPVGVRVAVRVGVLVLLPVGVLVTVRVGVFVRLPVGV